MLIQLHWQFKFGDHRTECRAQRDIDFGIFNAMNDMQAFVKETQDKYPLPRGAVWLACQEGSKYFVEGWEDEKKKG